MQTLKAYKKIIWTLHNMTKEKIERYEANDEIESSSTEVLIGDNATKWSLSFFPGGVTEDTRDFIGLCLVLVDANSTQFDVKYTLGVVGKEIVFTEAENTGEALRNGWGWFKFLKREELYDPNEGFLADGKLTIFCELEITATEATESDKSALFSQEILNRNKKMLEGEVYADFKIKTADGQVLKAHKAVLAVGSIVFRDMLASGVARKKTLKVSEDALVMKRILRYIYCYEIENLKENAHELVFAAEKYGLNKLKKMCINSMIESLTTENVLQTLLTADHLNESNLLKQKCFDLIASNDKQVSDEWELLSQRSLVEIIRHIKVTDNESRKLRFNNLKG